MRTDLYTRIVLTVIAVCLVWISLNGVTPAAFAQAGRSAPTQVILVDEQGTPVPTIQGLRVSFGPQPVPVAVRNQSLPVLVGNTSLPVHLTSIQRGARWDALDVRVQREPPTQMPTP